MIIVMTPLITFIVSTYKRPDFLTCCLASLRCQTMKGDIVVCDNDVPATDNPAYLVTRQFNAAYINTSAITPHTCYHNPARTGGGLSEWLCFPSDDSYYVPQFTERMLLAATHNGWKFVYCDMVYDPRITGGRQYGVLDVQPSMGRIDKTGFIIHNDAFKAVGGWPMHDRDWRDGALAEAVVRAKIKHGKVPGPMIFHN